MIQERIAHLLTGGKFRLRCQFSFQSAADQFRKRDPLIPGSRYRAIFEVERKHEGRPIYHNYVSITS